MSEQNKIQNINNTPENNTKGEVPQKKKSKKWLIILIAIIVILAIAGTVSAIFFFGDNEEKDNDNTVMVDGKRQSIKVVKDEASTVKYDTYDNGLVSFEYPSGWTVEVAPFDYMHYSFKVYDPKNPDYMILYGIKLEGALKSERARKVYASYYPDSPFAKITPIDPQTTEGFYNAWNGNSKYNNTEAGIDFYPMLNNFEVIETLGKDMVGGDILRASYTSTKGTKCQGIFTAAVKDVGSYYISEDIWNPLGSQVDVAPLNTYNIIILSAPEEEFVNWQSVLDHCIGTIQFSNTFMNGFNGQEDAVLKTVQSNQKIYDQISDSIMSSWEARSNSYDIISQKQSDATLGYERVYDTETGDIYKAYNGFTDDYTGDRYKPITDDMYTKATAGYIEK